MDNTISCDGCGACCMQQGHPPYTDEELTRVPEELKGSLDTYLTALDGDDTGRPCLWLDLETRQCRNYDQRPQICRDFERGSSECKLLRWRYRIPTPQIAAPPISSEAKTSLTIVESCDGCGVCCLQQGHPPYTDDELQYVPDDLLGPIQEHLAALEESDFGQPCIWFDDETKQCRHYEHRPQVCRDFERGCPMCVQLRLKYKI